MEEGKKGIDKELSGGEYQTRGEENQIATKGEETKSKTDWDRERKKGRKDERGGKEGTA
ncbi:hypothetical protein [Nonomuraea dietziae]|uniref:hypothetical protein n=1 Tax=Nonomuraea dietziae TaxID=65515 RepID=UPI0031D9C14D